MHKTMQLIFILVCFTAVPASAFTGGKITRMSDRQAVSFSQMMADTEGTDVILVAETHDNKKITNCNSMLSARSGQKRSHWQ